eukprot:GSA25T00009207001.1
MDKAGHKLKTATGEAINRFGQVPVIGGLAMGAAGKISGSEIGGDLLGQLQQGDLLARASKEFKAQLAPLTSAKANQKFHEQTEELKKQAHGATEDLLKHIDKRIVLTEARVKRYVQQTEDSLTKRPEGLIPELQDMMKDLAKQKKRYEKQFSKLFGAGT